MDHNEAIEVALDALDAKLEWLDDYAEREYGEDADAVIARYRDAATRLRATVRLEELRAAIDAENISYGEIAELQGLVEFIDPSDVQLLEWAGVPEFPENE